MGAASTDNFCLRWNDFAENVSGAFKELRAESDFFDVTLACSDSGSKTLQAHKVILSACSNFFKATFRQQMNAHKHPNPYIYLRGVSYSDLVSILDFIYNGEVNVAQEDLNSFLAVAEELQIKGLTNRENNSNDTNSTTTSSAKKTKRPVVAADTHQAPVKKVRRSSPAPTASNVTSADDHKDVVNIKDDPEAMASTSAVNPDDATAAAEYAGEDFDESYDGYYDEEGAEIGESGEGPDGTKDISDTNVIDFLVKIQGPSEVNGILQTMYRCDLCKKVGKDRSNMKRHMILIHAAPSNLPCPYQCGNVFKNKIYLATHVNSKICLRNQKFQSY